MKGMEIYSVIEKHEICLLCVFYTNRVEIMKETGIYYSAIPDFSYNDCV